MASSVWEQGNRDGSSQPLMNPKDEPRDKERSRELFQPVSEIKRRFCRDGLLWLAAGIVFQAAQVIVMSNLSNWAGAGEALFIRSIFLMSVVVFISWDKKKSSGFPELVICVLNGFTENLCIFFIGLASTFIWTGDVTAIVFNLPIPSSVLACLIFGEAMDLLDCGISLLNAIGLVLVARPSFLFHDSPSVVGDQTIGMVLAFVSLLAAVITQISIRGMTHRNAEDAPLLMSVTGMVGICISLCTALETSQWILPVDCQDWLLIFLVGGCCIGGYGCVIKALETENILLVTVLLTLAIPLNFLYDIIILGRSVELLTLGGVSLILGSTFALYLKLLCFQDN